MPKVRYLSAVALTLATAMPGGVVAQATPAPASVTAARSASTDALAVGLLRLEYALREHPPSPEATPGVHRAFDLASLAFFGGRSVQALATMDSLTRSVAGNVADVARYSGDAASAVAGAPAAVRHLIVGADTIPYRLFVPIGVRGRRPLLVAFHGAGGNENMFALAYGTGMLLRLAQERGMIVAMPLTNAFLRDGPTRFDAVVSAAIAAAPVDTSRIFVLGHSLGGIVAGQLATSRGSRVRAVACIASPCGGPADASGIPGARRAPSLVMAAENDLLIPLPRVQAGVAAAEATGRVIEVQKIAGQGHTLVVPTALPIVMEWFARAPAP
jgi:pimeloyl-ACP methyl ester carboxylesterase